MKNLYGLIFFVLFLIFPNASDAQNKVMNAKNNAAENQTLNKKQQSIAAISALTATGDLEKLRTALSDGLDAKLTIGEIREVLVQMYAYSGFPRSLNGINTFMKVLEERRAKGITDAEGKTATPIDESSDKYERGRKTLEKLSGQPQPKPAKGFGEFSPAIDRFLKEHLFADIFDSDVLNYQERELATISALGSMRGVESQLESHLKIGLNVGLTEAQLNRVFLIIENNVGIKEAETGRRVLSKVLKKTTNMQSAESETDNSIFPKGEKVPAENFTGTVYVQPLAPKNENNNFSIGSVTFEPNARSNWHTHPAGQTLIVTNGKGLYQEKGKPIRTIGKGDVIICDKDIEHWHGASATSQMSHIAISNYKDDTNVVWLKPVTDEEYNKGSQ